MASTSRQNKRKMLDQKLKEIMSDLAGAGEGGEKKKRGCPEKEGEEDEVGGEESREGEAPFEGSVEEEGAPSSSGTDFQAMFERFGADVSKMMQAKKKRMHCLTEKYMKGSESRMEELWDNYHNQRKKTTQEYSERFNAALQQWDTDTQQAAEQEEKLNNLCRQQLKIIQQARAVHNQRLRTVRELYDHFVKDMEEAEKSQESFVQGVQQELRKDMALLQKKLLMDMQNQEMAKVRKSLQSWFHL